MAADLTGIDNVGEFFSQHYLSELLEKDLADQSESTAAAVEVAQKALTALGRDLLRLLAEPNLHQSPRGLHEGGPGYQLQIRVAEALGFQYQSDAFLPLSGDRAARALAVVERHGEPYLAVLPGRFRREEEALLEIPWQASTPAAALDARLRAPEREATLGDIVGWAVEVEQPPRWIMIVSGAEVVLAERPRWGRGQYLRFDLEELFGRKDPAALRITASLLARQSLVPDGGTLLHDRLDESSHRHAQGVSADLKYAAREAVELLANEWVHYQRTTAKRTLHGERVARELTEECLVYLYRLLVLFYVESRAGELGLLPMNSPEYAQGYSIEALRDLEQVTLGPEAREGYFFDESLKKLFELVNEGTDGRLKTQLNLATEASRAELLERGFRIEGLKSPLFDPRTTPRLSRIKIRNEVLQKIIRLLSLTPEARRARGGKGWGRGRISYAQLGINQLGAVYEGLLSYTGFFARDTLYEVHRAGAAAQDATQQAWFVPEKDLIRYREDELLFDEGGQKKRRKYEPGTFIYRLAGRDRESSASYYTPEVLTRCLVKYALRELLEDKKADEILALSVCEPAMGSGAFLVEAVEQLADKYLERKQQETGKKVPPGEYAFEKQKVKAFLAEARCYGVDLNPMAAKLAGVSLWLATIHRGQQTPWFGARLAVGNSLVGARLEVWAAEDFLSDEELGKALGIVAKKHGESGELEEELERVLVAHAWKHADAVAEVRSRVERVKRLAGAPAEGEEEESEEGEASEEEQGKAQRKEVVKALKKLAVELKLPRHHRKPPRKVEARAVVAGERPAGSVWHFLVPDAGMSPFETDKIVAELAPDAISRLKPWRKGVEEPWSRKDVERLAHISDLLDAAYKAYADARRQVLEGCSPLPAVWGQQIAPQNIPSIENRERRLKELRAPGGPYARLKRIMDLWSALWAWPLEHTALLPSRSQWIGVLEEALDLAKTSTPGKAQTSIWPKADDDDAEEVPKTAASLWSVVEDACERLRPMHWELAFPEVFLENGGFSLVVGNPPWIKLEWNERGILEEFDPRVELDGLSASEIAKRRGSLLAAKDRLLGYLNELTVLAGYKAALASVVSYPLLAGLPTNLYKSFLAKSWQTGAPGGIVGLIHQEGIFNDPKGGQLRSAVYARLRLILQFRNELNLFPDVGHVRPYALSLTSAYPQRNICFRSCANLFHPATFDESMTHDGRGSAPGIKTDQGDFEVRAHRSRVVDVTIQELELFARLFDGSGTPAMEARLPLLHTQEVLSVLARLASHPKRLGDVGDVFGTEMWHETGAQKDGTIRRETRFPKSTTEWILSGPHFYVGTPFNKTPRAVCDTKGAYDVIGLDQLAEDYLPRTNYVPACSNVEYQTRAPQYRGRSVADFFRHVHREMISVTGERTLISALVPPGAAHIHTVATVVAPNVFDLVAWSALSGSLAIDFLVRVKGAGHLQPKQALHLPAPTAGAPGSALTFRWLRLNALTVNYAPLWQEIFPLLTREWEWSLAEPRLSKTKLVPQWHRDSALRNAFERRWALVEIDALAALELKLTIDEICTIYRTQFPVLREYEKNTWYDRKGRIAFTNNRGLSGVGLERKDFELWQSALKSGASLPKDFDTQGLEPPFDVRDREDDMRTAYAYFAEKLGKPAS